MALDGRMRMAYAAVTAVAILVGAGGCGGPPRPAADRTTGTAPAEAGRTAGRARAEADRELRRLVDRTVAAFPGRPVTVEDQWQDCDPPWAPGAGGAGDQVRHLYGLRIVPVPADAAEILREAVRPGFASAGWRISDRGNEREANIQFDRADGTTVLVGYGLEPGAALGVSGQTRCLAADR